MLFHNENTNVLFPLETAPKNFNSRTAEKKCLFNSNCPHEKGRAGVNLELVGKHFFLFFRID